MKIIFPCAKAKTRDGFLRDDQNRRVLFVAHPALAQDTDHLIHAHPDDRRPDGRSWREYVLAYPSEKPGNPDGLHAALDLYIGPAFAALRNAFRPEHGDEVLILSPGWGLVSGSTLLPHYDITFSTSERRNNPQTYRGRYDSFDDFNMLDRTATEELVFIGGKDNFAAFAALTHDYAGKRTVFFHSRTPPILPGCDLLHFAGKRDIMWPHDCAVAVAAARQAGRDIHAVGVPASSRRGFGADDPFSLWQVSTK